jgi:hypothetical protein
LRLSFGHATLVGGLLRGEEAASDELLLVCAGEEGWAGTTGVPTADWGPRDACEGYEEMFRLQDRTTVIPDASSWTLILIDREVTLEIGAIFLIYFSHNAMPTWGVGVTYL